MPERIFPLTPFAGARVPGPPWFESAIAAPHVDGTVDVKGAAIAWRRWGQPGKKGLLFVHGGVAHLGWWDFIAPFFTDRFTPAALSLSGMGRSGWREQYDVGTYADEALAAAEAAGLFEPTDRPLIVGHSFGGFVTLATIVAHGARFEGAVICDSPIRKSRERTGPRADPRRRGGRVYATEAEALARFSLMPAQDCENLWALDHIARTALKDAPGPGGGMGKAWVHDPELWLKMEFLSAEPFDAMAKAAAPFAFVRGEQSVLVDDERWEKMGRYAGPRVPRVSIPQAQHHLMLDQPLAFVSALRALLGVWPA